MTLCGSRRAPRARHEVVKSVQYAGTNHRKLSVIALPTNSPFHNSPRGQQRGLCKSTRGSRLLDLLRSGICLEIAHLPFFVRLFRCKRISACERATGVPQNQHQLRQSWLRQIFQATLCSSPSVGAGFTHSSDLYFVARILLALQSRSPSS